MTTTVAAAQVDPMGGPALPQRRNLVTSLPGPRSQEWMARKMEAVSHSIGSTVPLFAQAAGGGVIVDVDGNSLIDFASGIAVTTVGNSDPRVVAAIQAQLQRFTHTCFTVSPYDSYVEVAEELNRMTPGDHQKRSVLASSGSEAVENAVKIARHYTGRQAIVVFDHAYHGRTNLTMGMSAKNQPFKQGFGPFAPEVYRVPMSYPLRDGGLSGPEAARRSILQIEKQVGAGNVAAVIIEPIMGEGGFIVPAEGFLPAIASWAKEAGALFVAEEIQTGFARTGDMFAIEHEGVIPDLVVTAKGIAAGMPLAGVTGNAEVMDSPQLRGLGGTYGGNPLACVAALAAFEAYEHDDLTMRARQIGGILTERFDRARQSDPRLGEVRGRGAMMAIELVDPETNEPDAALTARMMTKIHAAGVVLLSCGTYENVIRFLPPLSTTDELVAEGAEIVADALAGS